MQTYSGIAVSPGVAIGEALVIDQRGPRIPKRFVDRSAVDDELQRLAKSIESVAADIRLNRDAITGQLGEHYGAIFSAQLQMVTDPELQRSVEALVRDRNYSPEYAVSRTLRRYAKVFQDMENRYLAERSNDVLDIEKRLLADLLGKQYYVTAKPKSPVIVVAHNLTPSEAAGLDREYVLGFVSEIGGPGSHTAIVAEAMEIPAVVGTGEFLNDDSSGEVLIVDGDEGLVIIRPDEPTINRYQRELDKHRCVATKLARLNTLPAETIDGTRISIRANIEFPDEVQSCVSRGADGIGLYRTEFLYLGADHEPTEEDHFQAYSRVVQAMGDCPVVIRTLDLGADKMGRVPNTAEERNPFLGLRSIRLSLKNPGLFRTQLRAILRASALGDIRVMFPLISTISELREAKSFLAEEMENLRRRGLDLNSRIQVGMMVEVPASVMLIDRFIKEVDFLSIGTNDLIQYTLAVDRSNKDVASLYNASDPAILQLIRLTMQAGENQPVETSLCGQMSSNPVYTMLLLGLGLRTLSVPPAALAEIKNVCRNVTIQHCDNVAQQALCMENANEITEFLKYELEKVSPPVTVP